jgi:hypothetical protein
MYKNMQLGAGFAQGVHAMRRSKGLGVDRCNSLRAEEAAELVDPGRAFSALRTTTRSLSGARHFKDFPNNSKESLKFRKRSDKLSSIVG